MYKAAVFIENFSHGRMRPVVCYYLKGQALRPYPWNYSIDDVPGHLCSHVNLAYIELSNTKHTLQEDPTIKFAHLAQLKKKFPRLMTFISIGGDRRQTEVISAMASMEVRRKAFINDTVKLLVDHKLDGLDISWLFPDQGGRTEDKANFVRTFEGQKATVFYWIALSKTSNHRNSRCTFRRYLDWMNVIGYDLRGNKNGRTDVHSPLHPRSIDGSDTAYLNVENGLQALLDRGASKRKLVLGVAFYGRVYRLANPKASRLHDSINLLSDPDSGEFLKSHEIHAYFEICRNIIFANWNRSFDSQGMCPYATNGKDWVGYEDEQSISKKVEFVRKEGYAGIAVLSLDMDDFRGECGTRNILLQTINNGMPRLRSFVVLKKK
ncbi:hypothetical protein MTO96_004125 [Rhipicephalus appendiculatus]